MRRLIYTLYHLTSNSRIHLDGHYYTTINYNRLAPRSDLSILFLPLFLSRLIANTDLHTFLRKNGNGLAAWKYVLLFLKFRWERV